MKNKLTFLFALLISCSITAFAQTPKLTIQEVKQKMSVAPAPEKCLLAFRELFRYLQRNDISIVRDERTQKLWLTAELRKALMQKVATFTSAEADPDFPGNGTFIRSWDYPTTYSIVSSRRYGNRAIIDVLYKWGPGTNYPSDERTTSFIFMLEDGIWKLDDIYTFRGKFVRAESLSQYFREK